MHYRMLGSTDIRVSAIGFGTWGIGGVTPGHASYGPTDDAESLAALSLALDHGITFYDTADIYGHGHSEELLAQAFATKRHQVVIASKVGYVDNFERQDFSPRHIRESLDASLARLRTDYLDVYQLHNPPVESGAALDELVDTLRALEREGKIRSVGVSLRSPEDGVRVIECGVDAIQVNVNLMDQRARTLGLLDAARTHRTGVIVRTPLASGFLSGPLDTATLDPRDHRRARSADQLRRWHRGAALFAALNHDAGRTPAQLALQFCLADASVSTVVPGMMRRHEVEENVGTFAATGMTDAERHAIQALYAGHEFFVR
jgi:aryl-alcohol dehydrogenase-like predicted oxidoreductase